MNVFDVNMGFLDYNESDFVFRFRKNEGGTYLKNISIKSKEEFYSTLDKKEDIGFNQFYIYKIKLQPNIEKHFFTLLYVEGGVKYLVSEKLRNKIENSNCTGIEFMPAEMRLTDWLHGEREKIYGKV